MLKGFGRLKSDLQGVDYGTRQLCWSLYGKPLLKILILGAHVLRGRDFQNGSMPSLANN